MKPSAKCRDKLLLTTAEWNAWMKINLKHALFLMLTCKQDEQEIQSPFGLKLDPVYKVQPAFVVVVVSTTVYNSQSSDCVRLA